MKLFITILLLLPAVWLHGCAGKVSRPPHGLSMKPYALPEAPAVLPVATFESVEGEVEALRATIGRYPPRFESEEHREEIYGRWRATLVATRSLDTSGDRMERKLYLLSELYRQGHNLDVVGAGPEALTTVENCVEAYPRSRRCHLSASYLYLSTTGIPGRLDRADRSLTVLRELGAPGMDEDAEAGFIWLAIHRRDGAEASRLIDRYLMAFPQSSRAKMFREIRGAKVVTLENWPGP